MNCRYCGNEVEHTRKNCRSCAAPVPKLIVIPESMYQYFYMDGLIADRFTPGSIIELKRKAAPSDRP